MNKYTIKDIAELAGVSKGTVDRVIHKRGNVAKDVEKKVKALLKEINYQPNLIARNLKFNKVYTIGVLLPDPNIDAYWETCIMGIDSVLAEFNAFGIELKTQYFNPTDTISFTQANEMLKKANPDAILMVPLFYKEAQKILQDYAKSGITVSTFNNEAQTNSSPHFIGQDLFQSGRVAAKLLHSISREGDVAIIHVEEKYKNAVFMQEKEKGFKSYYNELDNFKGAVLKCKLKYSNLELKLIGFLDEHPNVKGIYVTTSKGYHVAKLLQSINLGHIKFVGYDLLSENVAYLKSGVIDFLIHQNPKQQVYLGLKFLVEHLLFGKEIPDQYLLPIDIINSENVKPFMRP